MELGRLFEDCVYVNEKVWKVIGAIGGADRYYDAIKKLFASYWFWQ